MDFLFEVRLRQEAAMKYNPVTQTKKFERIFRRKMKLKKPFLKPKELNKSDVHKIESLLARLFS
jgi:hypothetical protein